MANVPFGPITLPPGTHTFGPVTIAGITQAVITIDRTAGLNALTSASTLSIEVQSSIDGGTTYLNKGGGTTTGGIFSNHNGQENSTVDTARGFDPGANRVQVVVVVGGPSNITLAGSIATS